MRWYWRWPPCTPAPPRRAETRYSLANGCFAVRSTDTGAYVSRSGSTRSLAEAEPFRMKAATLGKYLLYGTKGDYLTPRGRRMAFTRNPSVWTVDRSVRSRDGRFSFVRTGVCARFPEATAGAKGPAFKGATRLGEVSGTLDAHGHLTAYEFIGGKFHCGKPWSPLGIQDALPDCSKDRGPGGSGAPLQNLLDFGSPVSGKDQVGYPTFKDWPSTHALTYEGTYWKWVERSWRSGLRMMVTLLVDNEVLCDLQTNRVNPCDDMEGAKLQRKRLYELQDYIDAQYGGPGKGFLRIVTDPFQARRVVADGKLAVVMGMETSALFGCRGSDQAPECDQAKVDRGLASSAGSASARSSPCTSSTTRWAAPRWTAAPPGWWSTPATRSRSAGSGTPRPAPAPRPTTPSSTNGGAAAGALANAVKGTPLAGVLSGQAPVYPPGPALQPARADAAGPPPDRQAHGLQVDRGDRPHERRHAQPDAGHPGEAQVLRRDLGPHVGVAAELPAHLQAGRRRHPRGRLPGRRRLRQGVGGLPQAARQALLLRVRLRLGHQRPGRAGLAARRRR